MTASDTLALCANGIHKRFVIPKTGLIVDALNDISISIPKGILAALVGPDGAGKTTLLRLAVGLMKADTGTLSVLGLDAAKQAQDIQNRISYMPQNFGLYEDLSIQENLDLYANLHGVPKELRLKRYADLLETTGLTEFTKRLAGQLSGGMKKKLSLICTLVRSPELLILDEPTVGVDPLSRRELWEILKQLVKTENLSVIVSTSYLDEAERCSLVFLLHQGKLLAQGAPSLIRDNAKDRVYIATPHAHESVRTLQAKLLDHPETYDAVPEEGKVRFIKKHADSDLNKILQDLAVHPVPARLEDGFMVLLRQVTGSSKKMHAPATHGMNTASSPPSGNPEVVIEVRDLVRKFGDFIAVNNTNFSVYRGEIFGLLGPNGAGKTTTFRMLCGLLPASSGFLRVAGVDLRRARAEARRNIGYVSQKFALYGYLSVMENLQFFGGVYGLYGKHLHDRIEEIIREFDLTSEVDRPSHQLPGGFKQRLAMAAALMHRPQILFLDEPTSGADPIARREFWRRITSLAEQGTTIIITTHFMEEAEYCDRIAIQDSGSVLALGTPYEVKSQAGSTVETPMNMDSAFIEIVEKSRQEKLSKENAGVSP